MNATQFYQPYTKKLILAGGFDPNRALAWTELLKLEKFLKVTEVKGTVIPGTSSEKVFTATTEIFANAQTIVLTNVSGTSDTYPTFAIGETVTGGSSGATGKVVSSSTVKIVVDTLTGLFTAAETITGGTSAITATVSSVETTLQELQYGFFYSSSIKDGAFLRLTSNTYNTVTAEEDLPSGATNLILFMREEDFINNITLQYTGASEVSSGTLEVEGLAAYGELSVSRPANSVILGALIKNSGTGGEVAVGLGTSGSATDITGEITIAQGAQMYCPATSHSSPIAGGSIYLYGSESWVTDSIIDVIILLATID
jgi:hypothetical protein